MNNRQAGRRRGRGGQRQPGSGGGNPRDNGNRIDNRARGNAAQLLEKYRNLAADAQRAGDRVNTEYYLQFADHYFRVLEAGRSRVEEQRRARDEFDGSDDEDFDGDGDTGADTGGQDRGQRDDRGNRDDRGQRDDRQPRAQRDDRGNREDRQPREERQAREERQPRDDRGPREDRPQRERLRRDGGRSAPANDGAEQRGVEGEVGTQQNEVVTAEVEAAPEAKPVRRRTPRARVEAAPAEAEVAPSLDADRLPPALSANDDAAERPRRRRRVRADEEEAVPPAA
ncbi:DUF4167 domain-containing protein [Sphingomonas hankookensis]